jgi:predicted RND superfamily exporter protein
VERIAAVIVGHARRILAVTGIVSIAAVAMLFRMDFNADIASFVLEGNPTGEAFAGLQDKYGAADPINVVASLEDGSDWRAAENLARLAELRDTLAGVDGVAAVASIVPERNPLTGEPITPETIRLAPPGMLTGLIDQSPTSSLLLSDDGRHTMLFVSPDGDRVAAARRVVDLPAPDGIELVLSGNPVVFASVLDVLSLILLFIPPAVIGLLLVVFYLTIGDRRLSALAMVPAALGALWTFGLIFALGREVDVVTVIVPIFVIVMGSADGLHFVTHFQQESGEPDPVRRVTSALSHVGVPMILTTVSTAAGFLSLVATGVRPIEQLGLFTAVGIGFAGLISFFSLPALASRLHIEPRHHDAVLGPRLARAIKAAMRSRVPAAAVASGIVLFAVVTIPRLDVDPDQLFFFKDDDPVRVAFERTEELFGGATPLMGEFAFDPQGPDDQLDELRAVSRDLESLPGIRRVFSVADAAPALPDDQLAAVLSGEAELPLGDLVSDDGLRFIVLPAGFTTADLQQWLEFADAEPRITVLTGMPVVWDEIARLVLRSQVVSLFVAFALVAVMLALAYRRLRQTIVSLAPIALTVAALLGFIAASGIQLNLLTAVISGIVIGVGIDYSIHFVAAVDRARRDGPGYVLRAVDGAGPPIAANALGIAVALSALWISPLAVHPQVSMIMWVAMITAAVTAFLVIAALLPRPGVEPAGGAAD